MRNMWQFYLASVSCEKRSFEFLPTLLSPEERNVCVAEWLWSWGICWGLRQEGSDPWAAQEQWKWGTRFCEDLCWYTHEMSLMWSPAVIKKWFLKPRKFFSHLFERNHRLVSVWYLLPLGALWTFIGLKAVELLHLFSLCRGDLCSSFYILDQLISTCKPTPCLFTESDGLCCILYLVLKVERRSDTVLRARFLLLF